MKRPPARTVYAAIRDAIYDRRVEKQKQRVEDAIKAHAKLCGDAEYQRTMANHYTSRVADIDPYVDWVGFAYYKGKEADHVELHQDFAARAADAAATIDAEQARYVRLLDGLAETRK